MAKGRATGFVLEGDRLEWVALAQSGDSLRRIDQGLEILASSDAEGAATAAPDAMVEQVRTACAAIKGDTVLGLPSTAVLLRVVDLPVVDETELPDMVELQADKFAPFPIETMAVSHEVLVKSENHYRVLVAAARNDVVDAHARVLVDAGRRPDAIDSCVLGWWRVLQDSGKLPLEGRSVQIVAAGIGVELMVVQDGVPLVFRSLDTGADASPGDLAADVAQELRHTLITLELEHGSQPCEVGVWAYQDQVSALVDALRPEGVGEITAHSLEGLPSVSEGLARRLMAGGCIDLTPQTWRAADTAARQRRRMIQWLGGAVGMWLLLVLSLAALFGWRNASVKRLQARRQTWEAPAMEVRELRRRVLMIDRYTDMSHSALECLREISRVQPQGIDLGSFTYTKGDTVRLLGKAADRSQIYAFKQALDDSGLFPQVELGTQVQDRKQRHWSFDMVLALPGGEGDV